MSPAEMVSYLDGQISQVEDGPLHESACATLVAPSMRAFPIRPKVVDHLPNGSKLYLLNLAQAKKLREVFAPLPTEDSQ